MKIELLPIKEFLPENTTFLNNPDCQESLEMSVLFYARVGYSIPWIGYYASLDGMIVGSAGFKGKPVDNRVEIAYATFPDWQHKGIGEQMCQELVRVARDTNSLVRIMARTLMEENFSVRILKKNGFEWKGKVVDPDDGEVWEWEYQG